MTGADKFSTHQFPAWRERSDFIINAKLPEAGCWEQLWVRRISGSTFELCCIPFFLYDVALGDVVQTKEFGGKHYVLDKVVTSSGRYVFRVHFPRPSAAREEVTERLGELDATLEWSSASLLAVDASSFDQAQQVADLLAQRADMGHLLYETGKTT